ncbi:NRDE protein-domain-containing protein [Blastocladiella britannica]|nr:NRDE protein-domain-containing protein [Blastocladiella britannica]
MCIVFLAFGPTILPPPLKLLIASNRDEYLHRATHRAHVWPISPHHRHAVVCGVDLARTEQGTWLGIASTGAFALLTNIREPLADRFASDGATEFTDYLSRGRLVRDFLDADPPMSATQYIAQLRATAAGRTAPWLGFNLIIGSVGGANAAPDALPDVYYVTNRSDSPLVAARLEPGVWGITNGTLILPHTESTELPPPLILAPERAHPPGWEKALRGVRRIESILRDRAFVSPCVPLASLEADLWSLLQNEITSDPSQLPLTGLDPDIEHWLSAIRVPARRSALGSGGLELGPWYGTRSSTIVAVDDGGAVQYLERDWTYPVNDDLSPAGRKEEETIAPNTVATAPLLAGDAAARFLLHERPDRVTEWRFVID